LRAWPIATLVKLATNPAARRIIKIDYYTKQVGFFGLDKNKLVKI
jgi:hypothetical protein